MPHCPRAIPARAAALAWLTSMLVTAWTISLLIGWPLIRFLGLRQLAAYTVARDVR
jgi:hypothetical protein